MRQRNKKVMSVEEVSHSLRILTSEVRKGRDAQARNSFRKGSSLATSSSVLPSKTT
jgi:hypothetical protein